MLPQAIGVAISPLPIIAVILMLFSKRGHRSNGLAFLAGWVLALAVVGTVVLLLANAGKISAGGTPSMISYLIKLLLGLLFWFLAYRVVPPLSVVGWKTFPEASKRDEIGWRLAEKCRLRLPTHLCSFREGQQHSRG